MTQKSGWKTSEFWLTLAVNLFGALGASGILLDGSIWTKVVGMAIMVLGTLGYTYSRGQAKSK